MLQINKRYVRKSPEGYETIITINNKNELQYHTDLMAKKYQYTLVMDSEPRNNVCLNCEG